MKTLLLSLIFLLIPVALATEYNRSDIYDFFFYDESLLFSILGWNGKITLKSNTSDNILNINNSLKVNGNTYTSNLTLMIDGVGQITIVPKAQSTPAEVVIDTNDNENIELILDYPIINLNQDVSEGADDVEFGSTTLKNLTMGAYTLNGSEWEFLDGHNQFVGANSDPVFDDPIVDDISMGDATAESITLTKADAISLTSIHTSSVTNTVRYPATFRHTTSGVMADGFGVGIVFEQSSGFPLPLAYIEAVQDGGVAIGKLIFRAGTSGYEIFMSADSNGTIDIPNSLVVDTNTLYVNATSDRVGIGTTTPSSKLEVNGITKVTVLNATEEIITSSINSNTSQDLKLWEDLPIADNVDGQAIYAYRNAPEGKDYFKMFVDQYRQGRLYSTGNIQADAGFSVWFRAAQTVRFTSAWHTYFDIGGTDGTFAVNVRDGNYGTVASIDSDGNAEFNGSMDIMGNITYPAIYCESSDLNDQIFSTAGLPYRINITNNDEGYGIGMSTGHNGTNITFNIDGVYHMVAQPQVKAGAVGGGKGDFHMWIEKNIGSGFVNIPDSNIELSLGTNEEDVIVLATTLRFNQGDTIRFVASVSDNNILLHAQSPSGEPIIPSIIFTMFRVGN